MQCVKCWAYFNGNKCTKCGSDYTSSKEADSGHGEGEGGGDFIANSASMSRKPKDPDPAPDPVEKPVPEKKEIPKAPSKARKGRQA